MSSFVNNSAIARIQVMLMMVVGLSACGGGGGGGSSSSSTVSTAAVTITTTNSTQVAGAAVDSAFGGSSLPIALQTTSSSGQSAIAAGQSLSRIGKSAVQQFQNGGALAIGATTLTTCPLGGTATMNTGTSSGSLTYSNCSYTAGESMSGTITISNVSSTASLTSMDMTYSLSITTTSPANTATASGDMHIAMDNAFNMTMSGSNLSFSNTDASLGSFSLQNYSMSIDSLGNLTAMTYTFSSSVIGGTAIFTMTTPFTYGTGMFPTSGAATVTGASSTKLRITALGDENAAASSQVKLELSTDGGATYAAPTYATWATVSSLI